MSGHTKGGGKTAHLTPQTEEPSVVNDAYLWRGFLGIISALQLSVESREYRDVSTSPWAKT